MIIIPVKELRGGLSQHARLLVNTGLDHHEINVFQFDRGTINLDCVINFETTFIRSIIINISPIVFSVVPQSTPYFHLRGQAGSEMHKIFLDKHGKKERLPVITVSIHATGIPVIIGPNRVPSLLRGTIISDHVFS